MMKLIEQATVEVSVKYETSGGTQVLALGVHLSEMPDKDRALDTLFKTVRDTLQQETESPAI